MNGDNNDIALHRLAMSMPSARNASSTSMATLIDCEVQHILNQGREMARTLLSEHYDQLVKLADVLMEREQLDRKQFEVLLQE